MSQPRWHVATNLGDADPLNHGGSFVLIDSTGIYDPELWVYSEYNFEDFERRLYRINLERCFPIEGGHVGDNIYHSYMPAWFGKREKLKAVEDSADHLQLMFDLCSNDATKLANAYLSLIGHYGAYEFDQEPLILTKAEARKLIDRLLGAQKSGRPLNPRIR
jgi:hypothetical protein